jgi:hypothetical protein
MVLSAPATISQKRTLKVGRFRAGAAGDFHPDHLDLSSRYDRDRET